MKRAVFVLVVVVAVFLVCNILHTQARAAELMRLTLPDGATVQLTDQPGPDDLCRAGTQLVLYHYPDGRAVRGCYLVRDDAAWMAFEDGDTAIVPLAAFKSPPTL